MHAWRTTALPHALTTRTCSPDGRRSRALNPTTAHISLSLTLSRWCMAAAALLPPQSSAAMTDRDDDDDRLAPRLSFSLTRTETEIEDDYNKHAAPTMTAKSSDGNGLVTSGMTSAQIHETFLSAEYFVSVVLSRLQKDPMSVDADMWALQDQTNRLWALKQQALVGSCETSRGSKEYAQASQREGSSGDDTMGRSCWRPCCFRMMGESKLYASH